MTEAQAPSAQQEPQHTFGKGPLTDEQLKAMIAQAESAQPAETERPLITLENLDDVFTYHQWSPEQIARGNAIRAAAKAYAKSVLEAQENMKALQAAIRESGIDKPENPTDLYRYAQERRAVAIERSSPAPQRILDSSLSALNETVMIANSAITFEASQLVRDNPPGGTAA